MKRIGILLVLFFLIGCALTYTLPTIVAPIISDPVTALKSDILNSAKQVLISEGYQVASYDDSAGIISTATKNLRLTTEQADCGKTMGIDYLKDKRTTTRVAFGVIVDNGKLIVRANIEGEYKPGAVEQNITLTCVSRGILERDMLSKIKARLNY